MGIAFFLILLFISAWSYNWNGVIDYWWSTWTISLFFSSLIITYKIFKKYHWSLAIAFLAVIVSGLYSFSWYDNSREMYTIQVIIALRLFSCYAAFCFLLFSISAMFCDKWNDKILNSYMALCLINSGYVVIQWLSGKDYLNRGGFWGNGTNNASLIAFTYPLLFASPLNKKYKIRILIIPVIAILCTLTSVPVGVLFAGISTYIFFKIRNIKKRIAILLLLAISLFGIGYFLDPKHFFSSSLRFGLYKITWNEFWSNANLVIGEGVGTFHLFGPFFQKVYNHDVGQWNIFLHNDFLQTLLETGIIGFSSCIIMLFFAIFKLIKKRKHIILSCLMAYLGCAMFNFPLHYPMHAFFGLILLTEAFKHE